MKRRWTALALAGVLTLTLPGCSAGAATLAGKSPAMPTDEYYRVEVDDELRAALTAFSVESGGAVLLGEENLCYSPVSLYYALALAGTGAAGETQQEVCGPGAPRIFLFTLAFKMSVNEAYVRGLCRQKNKYIYVSIETYTHV